MDIKDIKTGKATITIITALNFFVPGGLGLFLLKNNLFISMDFAKLLLLSIILSAPFLLVSFIMAFLTSEFILISPHSKTESKEKNIPEDTEHNDLGMVLLTNVFSIVIWGMVGAGYWISDMETDNIKVAKQIINDYFWCSVILLIVLFSIKLFKKYNFNKKSH